MTPDPIICIHIGRSTWQGPQSEAPRCRFCGARFRPGIAMAQTFTGGSPDLGGDVMTFSAGGPGRIITCRKCEGCGHSVSHGIGVEDE